MIIMGIDVGKRGGLAVYDTVLGSFVYMQVFHFTSMLELYAHLKKLNDLYKFDSFVIGEAFGQRVVVKYQSKFYGVVELVSERIEIPTVYVSDRTARAAVLGKGQGNNKALVHETFKGVTPDVSDAMLFCKWYAESI